MSNNATVGAEQQEPTFLAIAANPWHSSANFSITLESGQTVEVKFIPSLEGERRMHQFDLTGPVSPTGFQSHFVPAAEAETMATPYEYGTQFVRLVTADFVKEQQAKEGKQKRAKKKGEKRLPLAAPPPATNMGDSSDRTAVPESSGVSEPVEAATGSNAIAQVQADLIELTGQGTLDSAIANADVLSDPSVDARVEQAVDDQPKAITLPQSPSKSSVVLDEAIAPVAVDVLELLTPEEEAERHRLELKVERAFYEAGSSLRELRDRRLYRSTHKTFEQYCRERFGFERRHPYRLIEAANVIDNLCPIRTQEVPSIRTQILPTKLEQVRPLTSLEPDEQRQVWQQAVNKAGGKVPTGRIVKGIVERLKEQGTTPPTIPYQVGDVVEIRAGANPTLRKHDGCWGIVTHVGSFSCTVHISVRSVDVQCKPDEMDIVDPKYTADIRAVSNRIAALAKYDLDPAVWSILETLSRQTCFTQIQLDLLAWAEERYLASH